MQSTSINYCHPALPNLLDSKIYVTINVLQCGKHMRKPDVATQQP